MEAIKKKIGIFYRYNKYRPISGSMFYALEYYFTLMDTIERENQDNLLFGKDLNETEVTFYWIFPKKLISTKEQREKFKIRLLRLAAAKYPLTYKWVKMGYSPDEPKSRTSINKVLDILDLNPIEKDNLLELNKKLDTYFRNIEIVSETDLLKINVDKSLFICQNTVHDSILSDLILNKPENFGAKYFICNREFNSLSPSHKSIWKNLSIVENSKFLYESPKQNILSQNSEQYSLKLGVDLFWKKEHIKKYKKYLKENHLYNFGILQTGEPYNSNERSFFTWIDDETLGYEQFHLYMLWDSIHYHRRNFEENNRAVIEAKFYNIPFKEISKINSKHIDHIDRNDRNDRNDSLQDRKENPKDYILTKDDKLINELLR